MKASRRCASPATNPARWHPRPVILAAGEAIIEVSRRTQARDNTSICRSPPLSVLACWVLLIVRRGQEAPVDSPRRSRSMAAA